MQWYTLAGATGVICLAIGCSGGGADEPSTARSSRTTTPSSSIPSSSVTSASSVATNSSIAPSSTASSSSQTQTSSIASASVVPVQSSSMALSSATPQSSSAPASSPASSVASTQSSQASSASGDIYADVVEPDVVQLSSTGQPRCVNCHVNGGPSGNTRLVFTAGAGNTQSNRTVFTNFLALEANGDQIILDKVRGGASHGGGLIFNSAAPEYLALAQFLGEITGNNNTPLDGPAVFAKLSLDDEPKTLRRAMLLLAGRLPTDAEMSAVMGNPGALRSLLRTAMEGDGFHDFLVRGANDRLHTDAFINGLFLDVMDPFNPRYPVLADMLVQANSADDAARTEFYRWKNRMDFGVSRAPVELIAHVVENDLPYTEVLTANYTMVNPYSAPIYNADITFADPTDATEFHPALNRGQILLDQFYDGEFVLNVGSVVYSHGDFVEYPHAGILTEPAFLNRYPTTDTNRNRARSRWTYYHFLDVDIEKSAPRTNDPDALADTDNPTMNNPNCTVCHIVMDPIAGTYQNFGDEGWYRDSWGGQDALPDTYKWAEDSPYVQGDTWYRDMRDPGFNGATPSSSQGSLQWLAQNITSDPRFARATVKFWWPAIMSEPVRPAPENDADDNYQAQLLGFEAQETLIQDLADGFSSGFNGGAAFNLKDLLVEMVMSPWFRAGGAQTELSAEEQVVLQGVGKARLLTPEELEIKTRSLIGFAWGERFDAEWSVDGHWSRLQDSLRIYYGGIDSLGITERADALNSLMANVALNQALSVSCPAVLFDFNRADSEKRLFKFVDRYTTPTLQDQQQTGISGTEQAVQTQLNLDAGSQTLRLSFDTPYWDPDTQQSMMLVLHTVTVTDANNNTLLSFDGEDLLSVPGASVSTNDSGNYTGGVYWEGGQQVGWQFWQGYVDIPISVATSGTVTISAVASRRNITDREALLGTSVNLSPEQNSAGQQAIRQQLQYLHQQLLGEWLATDDPEITASYNLLVELWQERQARGFPRNAIAWNIESCEVPIPNWWDEDHSAEFADPQYMQGTWMSMMVYFLTDYHYLHE